MRLDAFLQGTHVEDAGRIAMSLEEHGFHGVWITETQVDPFLPLAVAATATTRLRLGTGIAVALARSPMVTAMDAWALQRASGGRLDLGLGAQVRAHIERRFSMPYEHPLRRMKEYVAALRHIWGAFQGEHRLAFKGDFYSFSLMSPFFDPGPITEPRIAVYLAAVNERMYRLAGEIAEGIVGHPFSTPAYLRDVAVPAVERGLARSGRDRSALQISCPVFAVVDASRTREADERYTREQLAFYASTPAYRAVLEHHGWSALGEELSVLARAGRFAEMPRVVPDAVVETFVTRAPTYADLGRRLRERYDGVLDRVALYGDVASISVDDVTALAASLA